MDNEKFRLFVHSKLFELLQFVDGVCKKENIPYSLVSGTMLGAVRHGGFIPWDDDVDIVMLREDFERFKSVIGGHLQDTQFAYYVHGRVEGVFYADPQSFDGAEVTNLCCDVFILDNAPDDDKLFKKQIFGLKKLQGMLKKGKIEWKKYSFKGRILVLGTKILGAFRSQRKLLEKYKKLSTKYNGAPTKRKFISNDVFALVDVLYANELLEGVENRAFESGEFPVYSRFDEILTLQYGDYMTPPPESERVFLHTNAE